MPNNTAITVKPTLTSFFKTLITRPEKDAVVNAYTNSSNLLVVEVLQEGEPALRKVLPWASMAEGYKFKDTALGLNSTNLRMLGVSLRYEEGDFVAGGEVDVFTKRRLTLTVQEQREHLKQAQVALATKRL